MSFTAHSDTVDQDEFDDMWDQSVGTAPEDESERDDSEEPEAEDEGEYSPEGEAEVYEDDDPFDDGEDDEEEADDEDADDEDGEEPEDDGVPAFEDLPVADQLRIKAQHEQAVLDAAKKQFDAQVERVKSERQQIQTAESLLKLHASMTSEEWGQFSQRMMQAYAARRLTEATRERNTELAEAKTVIQAYAQRDAMIESTAAQAAMRELAITEATQRLGGRLSKVERLALENANGDNFMSIFEGIVAARGEQTKPARDALRERRQMGNRDRTPLRSTGGSQGTNNYDNFDPDNFGDYLSDQMGGQEVRTARPTRSRAAAR